jgi:hypothetical protein
MLVLVVIVGAGCSGGHHKAATERDVVGVTTRAYPEGPLAPHVKAGDRLWPEVQRALPAVLPQPLKQPKGCSFGNITSLTLANGKTIDYGPCRRPASIDAIRCVLAGCTINTSTTRATRLCTEAVPNPTDLVSSEATTIADFRRTTIGTIGPTQTHRFPALTAETFGAWCWTGSNGSYRVYEVASDGTSVEVGGLDGVSPAEAHGAPDIP